MASWLIVAILVLLVFLFFKTKRMQHKFYAILIIAFIIFFYITGSKIIAENNVDVKTLNGMVVAGKLYFRWLGNVIDNAKTIVGNVINMDW